jgi:hypothetical protein
MKEETKKEEQTRGTPFVRTNAFLMTGNKNAKKKRLAF